MVWIIGIGILLGLLGYLLWMPLELVADTAARKLELRAGHLAWARLEDDREELIHLRLHVPFATYCWKPTDLVRMHNKRKKKIKSRPKKSGKHRQVNWIQVFRSFRVRQFSWDLDTGDPVWNAQLYPLAFMLQQRGTAFRVNFWNQNRLAFRVTNRPVRLLKSFVNP